MHEADSAYGSLANRSRSHDRERPQVTDVDGLRNRRSPNSGEVGMGRLLARSAAVLLCLGLAAGARGQQAAESSPESTAPSQPAEAQHATTTTGDAAAVMSSAAVPPHDSDSPPPLNDDHDEKWQFRFTPYIWVPGTSGNLGIGPVNVPVDVSVDEAFTEAGNVNYSITIEYEARLDRFALFGNAMYVRTSSSDLPVRGPEKVSYSQNLGIFEQGIAYAFLDTASVDGSKGLRVSAIGGIRLWTVGASTSSRLFGDYSGSKTWLDGFGGATIEWDVNDWFGLYGRADVGAGGSRLTWNAQIGVDLQFADWGALNLGYRWLSDDYTSGSGADYFNYDLLMAGPYIGLSFFF